MLRIFYANKEPRNLKHREASLTRLVYRVPFDLREGLTNAVFSRLIKAVLRHQRRSLFIIYYAKLCINLSKPLYFMLYFALIYFIYILKFVCIYFITIQNLYVFIIYNILNLYVFIVLNIQKILFITYLNLYVFIYYNIQKIINYI